MQVSTHNNSQQTSKPSGYQQELRRDQSTWQLVRFGLLCMLPIAPTQVWAAAHVTSMGMAPLVYLFGALAMLFTALSYKWMTSEFPVAGSSYSYVQRGMHPYIGFLAGWLIVMDYTIVPGLLVKFSTIWLGTIAPQFPMWLIILVFVGIVTAVVAINGKVANWVNNFFLFGQLSLIAIFLICAFKIVIIDGYGFGGFSFKPFYNSDTFSFNALASAATIGMLGFIGFDSIATQSEEAKNARKAVGNSVILSLVIIALLFLGQGYMAALVHPDYINLDPDMGYFDVIREAGGDYLYYAFIILGVIFVGIANVIPVLSAISRVLYAMARDNTIPFSGFFKQVNKKYQTPMNATLFVGILSIGIAFFVELDFLSRLVNFGAMATYFLLNIAVITHFLFKKKQYQGASILKYGILPLIGAAIIGFIFSGFDSLTYVIGFSWLAIGVVILVSRLKSYKDIPPVIEEV
ncbi:APC family permease [Cohnella mopanensis]|uniref:APC family permease n=1 Tax=Cohnella mopanensis TaxID=2911966 RepID=UPI001EF7E7BF|nr:APC family permease [Cohnella mopanensis]